MKKVDPPIIVEEVYKCTADELWKALTDVSEMRRWYFVNIPDFKARVGFETEFDITNEDRLFRHRWKVTVVDAPRKLVYNWTFEQYEGSSDSIFEIIPQDNGTTRLRITVDVLEDFPEDIPEFKRQSCIGGWEYFLKERLKSYLG